ncbi:Hsp70 family protein [Paracoccus sp. 1_MG-2023]|uniref:Hsp70 family protein n=1 Tax=unclassified Paracoccus (in: a-proteobacteria) TaxID=2688777 RepID=UPI001C08F2C3|nr:MULTISPECIES: Hsp70 family protein [unclassified Paracoccus (in: a-proteobacteria)]MBU2957868.1 Hsp70 family protein [Paracoccus sp. C2R09]MDO6668940.1 Hsp70 family protein [Paracoccus sp. 1_MG-2023]
MAKIGMGLGLDFGTSNSAAGHVVDGRTRLIELEPGRSTMPTTFFFDQETRRTLIGEPANRALLDGVEGRFMRALKRVLGTSLMHERRQILSERVTFVDIIGRFLAEIRTRAEAETGIAFDRVLSGRPVVFHGADDPREGRAEEDLRQCYLAAGFRDIRFTPEPEAAAIASGALDEAGQVSLIVDIGGGTSDFSLFTSGPDGVRILANHGVRIGGTDFDRSISLDRVMPMLGKGTELRKLMGPGTSPVPNAIFNDLATWEKIPFLYTPQNRKLAAEMERLAHAPAKLARLATVLERELGHDLAFAVERGKIAVNTGSDDPNILLDQIERGFAIPLSVDAVADSLSRHAEALSDGADETLRLAGIDRDQVGKVVYVGGSSLMGMVSDTMRRNFPAARHSFAEVFTAVADGLAIAANDPRLVDWG